MNELNLKSLMKFHTPHIYHQIQQYKLVAKLKDKYRGKHPKTLIMKDRPAGFFSLFFQVLGAASYCYTFGHNLILDFQYGLYVDYEKKSNNWWGSYFEPDNFIFNLSAADKSIDALDITEKWLAFTGYGTNLPFKIGNQLITQLGISPKQEIKQTVSDFVKAKFQDPNIIGIHYRGTDKSLEAPRVPYDEVLKQLDIHAGSQFFVATDEIRFLEYMIQLFGSRVIYFDAIRSDNNQPLHYQNNLSNYQVGKEALIDCLLLSNCKEIIRTQSNLSLASSFFNPRLKVTTLNKTHY